MSTHHPTETELYTTALHNTRAKWAAVANEDGAEFADKWAADALVDASPAAVVAACWTAPEMLAALRSCLAFWDAPPSGAGCDAQRRRTLAEIIAASKAAIAKAEGAR